MRTMLRFGLSSILALGLAACGASDGGNTDAAYYPTPDAYIPPAVDTAPAIDTTPAPLAYVWVVIQDMEQNACSTNGPGVDVDAVTLYDATGTLGWGKKGTATYTANGLGAACPAGTCGSANTSPCKYAANGGVFTEADLVGRTEGAADAQVLAVGDDSGYFALNAGTLQMQIGAGDGTGVPMVLKQGDYLKVFEVDQSYVKSGAAYSGCTCQPDHYTVSLQTANPADAPLPLKPVQLDPNSTTCEALTSTSLQGCGSTVFVVP